MHFKVYFKDLAPNTEICHLIGTLETPAEFLEQS